jgi:multicomponent Na+:H+ antiporter subunit G
MIGVAFGVANTHIDWIPKLIIIIVFIAISNPIGSSAIARATYKSQQIPDNLQQDDFKDRGEE